MIEALPTLCEAHQQQRGREQKHEALKRSNSAVGRKIRRKTAASLFFLLLIGFLDVLFPSLSAHDSMICVAARKHSTARKRRPEIPTTEVFFIFQKPQSNDASPVACSLPSFRLMYNGNLSMYCVTLTFVGSMTGKPRLKVFTADIEFSFQVNTVFQFERDVIHRVVCGGLIP